MNSRTATVRRTTRETSIELALDLDGSGVTTIDTGIGFLDHMLTALSFHAGFDVELIARGDLDVDDHHTVEDCALVFGQALDQAMATETGEREAIARFGSAYAPLDEALARVVVDISGRPFSSIDLGLRRERLGALSCENIGHFMQSLATAARMTLHVDVLRRDNDHHRAEAAFKALALALRQALAVVDGERVPSTKGTLTGGTTCLAKARSSEEGT